MFMTTCIFFLAIDVSEKIFSAKAHDQYRVMLEVFTGVQICEIEHSKPLVKRFKNACTKSK